MIDDASTGRVRAANAAVWTGGSVLLVATVLVVGVGLVAVLGEVAHKGTWDLWSSIGQAFGVLASVLSGLALAAVVIVFRAQHRELIQQQAELALQRDELRRSAEANVRMLHVHLIEMAINDPLLAAVWPSSSAAVTPERHRQYLYANLILQHARQHPLLVISYTDEEFARNLRHLFGSPIIREFWWSTAAAREQLLVPGTEEFIFVERADVICREYD
jgi:protein-S-isoprenylcysteine O-methyltransferase Ste14